MASINRTDELVILLIFVNEHLVNAATMERCRMRTKCECRRCEGRDSEHLAKAIIRVYKNEINCGDTLNT